MLTLQLLLISTLYVLTGGAVFTDYGKEHPKLVGLAGIVAVCFAHANKLRSKTERYQPEALHPTLSPIAIGSCANV